PEQSREIVDALAGLGKPVTYCNVASACGHDAFLLPDDLETYGGMLRGFLSNLSQPPPGDAAAGEDVYGLNPSSIFHPRRLDYDRIVGLIPAGASVLDLGCGRGALLSRLRARGHTRLTGVELDERAVVDCARAGLDVIQADLNAGLGMFADSQYDVVVLSHTLQAIRDVERILDDMARVGRRVIVSFPNFGYHKLRRMLAEQGRAPESPGILRFKWYNSPNIRFFTIADFEDLCRHKGLRLQQTIALDTEAGREVEADANALADMAIFVVSR
ncbi:MAG TPA: methionine biosynthesis protein MetW, partial [Candidatus Brocadiia bacterium]|nr:methionine biosynthesis protein MetW [Candidatus Brocadiia bacterium]